MIQRKVSCQMKQRWRKLQSSRAKIFCRWMIPNSLIFIYIYFNIFVDEVTSADDPSETMHSQTQVLWNLLWMRTPLQVHRWLNIQTNIYCDSELFAKFIPSEMRVNILDNNPFIQMLSVICSCRTSLYTTYCTDPREAKPSLMFQFRINKFERNYSFMSKNLWVKVFLWNNRKAFLMPRNWKKKYKIWKKSTCT